LSRKTLTFVTVVTGPTRMADAIAVWSTAVVAVVVVARGTFGGT